MLGTIFAICFYAATLILVVGVALFVQLARAIFAPAKILAPCTKCGLTHHEPDAVHCKHCGAVVNIRTDGMM